MRILTVLPFLMLPFLILAACASPAPEMFGAARHDITLDGIRFAVFQKGNEAEVIRLGYLTREQRARVPELMMQAAARTTGCAAIPGSLITRLPGDTGEARVSLDCRGPA
ncbi:hypothetical protein [Paracoccus pacificus]|uniref:Lipoprotein n=1 Tax=Paracoccus pacificus TaxID=1463598 RepID=A0ABW4RDD5_9RHOB